MLVFELVYENLYMRVIKLVFKDNRRQASVAAADCLSVDMCTVADCTLWTLICIHF